MLPEPELVLPYVSVDEVPVEPELDPEAAEEPDPEEPEPDPTRRLFCTWFTPLTLSAQSSARRLSSRRSTVPLSVTSPFDTLTSMFEASTDGSSLSRSDTSSRTRSSERE